MQTSPSAGIRQLESLLQEKLIPWAENGAPLLWLGTPPRSALPLDIREETKPPLPPLRARLDIQKAKRWKEARVNSVEVPVLGCVYEGKVDYIVRAAPGEPGRQWTIPIKSGSFFLIPPGIPFLDGSDPPPNSPFERGILMYLRRDGIQCHSYTRDKGKVWLHPYIFLSETETWLPGERLLREMQSQNGLPDAVVYHYLAIILHFMLRGIRQGNISTLVDKNSETVAPESTFGAPVLTSKELVQLAASYVERNFKNADLSAKDIATHMGVSTGHLNRLFHREKSMTAIQYLQIKRLEKAKTLLQTSAFSINLISHLCGFRNQSHFSHWFTRQTSYSPIQYRTRQR
jgi:AraC-like DNA-binding protein